MWYSMHLSYTMPTVRCRVEVVVLLCMLVERRQQGCALTAHLAPTGCRAGVCLLLKDVFYQVCLRFHLLHACWPLISHVGPTISCAPRRAGVWTIGDGVHWEHEIRTIQMHLPHVFAFVTIQGPTGTLSVTHCSKRDSSLLQCSNPGV